MSKPKSLLYHCQLKLYYELHRKLVLDLCYKIESKKTIKYLDKVKKDPLKMLKIYYVLSLS